MNKPTLLEYFRYPTPILAMFLMHLLGIALTANTEIPEQGSSASPEVHWLDNNSQLITGGTAFGVPWPRSSIKKGTEFSLQTPCGTSIPVQTWVTATWPDGSVKWTGHALAADAPHAEQYHIVAGHSEPHPSAIHLSDSPDKIEIDTGTIICEIPKKGAALIASVERDKQVILKNGHLTGTRQNTPESQAQIEAFKSSIHSVTVEQRGPIRAVVKVDGMHQTENGREWLPFSVRLYFHAGSDEIKLVHTFLYDGDENKDFISSLGVRFQVPFSDEPYNRHVRLSGTDKGLWAESPQGVTGLRRDPGEAVRKAQIDGKKLPAIETWDPRVSSRIHWIPKWNDYTLSQLNANGFTIKKRTKTGHTWINADQGTRSNGVGYVGGASGGVAFGMRDFWKLHPTQIDIRNAATDTGEVTVWIWSPEAQPMDLRFYHDGMGQDIEGPLPNAAQESLNPKVPESPYAKQLDALNITYEDYEPGFGSPYGVGRTTDLFIKVCDSTPSRESLSDLASAISNPPQLVVRPIDYLNAKVFSNMWGLPNRSSENLSALEDRLDWSINYYFNQVEQRHWYGFWDFGDVMHTYDRDRHVWRYDVGGFAWDNSELSTDMWLWYSFLRTGDLKAFRLAEAMNRHNRDVDIYHLGRFKGLGTRHNVQHWGCSAKQLRISTSMNRRFHYFITTDERTGDVLREVLEADRQLANINPVRKLPGQPFNVEDCRIGVGTDWGSAVSNWLTEWERTGDPKYRQWIENSMRSIGNSKWGFFTGTFAFDVETKVMIEPENPQPSASHLNTMFGLPEVCAELIDLIDIPEFEEAWLDYCRYYNAPKDELVKRFGPKYRDPGFVVSHSRITAYAAAMESDTDLANRAASELFIPEWGVHANAPKMQKFLKTERIEGPEVLNPIDEASWVGTNDSAQWGLAAIQASALIPAAVGNCQN